MNLFFGDINGTSYYNDLTQYYQGSYPYTYIQNHSQLVTSWQDAANPYPNTNLFSSDILSEVKRAITVNGWNPGSYSQINVILGAGEMLYNGQDCGFHDSGIGPQSYVIQYTAVAYLQSCNNPTCPNNCYTDTGLNVLSHETFEATTDPFPACTSQGTGGWFDVVSPYNSCNGEIGDKCSGIFDGRALDGNLANHLWNGRYYILQDEWDNAATNIGTGGDCTTSGP